MNYIQKLWTHRRYLTIEAFSFFYIMPGMFNAVAIQNFPLEKACRVNLGYNKIICDTTFDKGDLGIDCDDEKFGNMSEAAFSMDFNYTVCKAESEAQKLVADVAGKSAPAAAIFPLIVLLFAGGWADRYNKRKPCMVLPAVGGMLSYVCLLISAIYFDDLPMEFGSYLEAIVPALFGGSTLFLMALYSYMTIATPEKDRVFRFGIFAMFITIIPFLGLPISGWLLKKLGYTICFILGLVFQLIAILYVLIFIKEFKSTNSKDADIENHASNENMNEVQQQHQHHEEGKGEPPIKLSLCRELFDYTLLSDFVQFPFIKRPNNKRLLLNLLLAAYFLTMGPVTAEDDYWYRYTLRKFGWNGTDFSIYSTFTMGMAVLGTFIGTALLSKILKCSDSTIGILSSLSMVLSHVVYAFSKDILTFYLAGVIDMLISLRVIAIKSIGSSIVAGDELGKMYSIFGISEPIGQFIFPPLYSAVYQATVDTFPGAIFLFGEIFYIPNVLVFVLCYFLLRGHKSESEEVGVENVEIDGHT